MLLFDKARHSYTLILNWMGNQLRIPIFMVGETWKFDAFANGLKARSIESKPRNER
jgi:hypothetical protein